MKRYLVLVATLLCVSSAGAQQLFEDRYNARGLLFNRDVMSLSEMADLSRTSFQYGTARSMAMAGALTSLGGDASSMMINPAGLGMYRKSDYSITPMVTIQRSDLGDATEGEDLSRTPFALGNIAAVFNLFNRSEGKLISLNFGLGINRIADYNYGYSTVSRGNSSSVANLFSRQLTAEGVDLDAVWGSDYPNWNSLPTNLWSAAMGYKAGMTFQRWGETPSGYTPSGAVSSPASYREPIISSDEPVWTSTWINPDATVDQIMDVESDGSTWEFDMSMGANIDNKLYLGATLGVQSIYQRLDLLYYEGYNDNSPAYSDVDSYLDASFYSQAIVTSGTGVNVKLGAIYRPTDEIRIGVSYHTPTYYSLSRTYQTGAGGVSTLQGTDGDITSAYAAESPVLEDDGDNRWRYRSSGKLLAGVSYTFNNRGLIAFDYQLDRYGNTTMRSVPYGVSMDFYDAGDVYNDVHTLKVGGEYKLIPQVALRAGFAYSTPLLRDSENISSLYDLPTINKTAHGSFGIGVALSPYSTLDLTYMAQVSDYSAYTLFYADGTVSSNAPSVDVSRSGEYFVKLWQHNIALTLSIKM